MLVVNTIVAVGPITFLNLSEESNGQIDAIFSPASPGVFTTNDYTTYRSLGQYMNFTQANELYGALDNFAPRKQMYASKLINEGVTEKVTVTLIDTEREKEINLGA